MENRIIVNSMNLYIIRLLPFPRIDQYILRIPNIND